MDDSKAKDKLLFSKFLKNYFYICSVDTKVSPKEGVEKVFMLLVDTMRQNRPAHDYGMCILPSVTPNETDTNLDVFISYNPEYLIDEKNLANTIRSAMIRSTE